MLNMIYIHCCIYITNCNVTVTNIYKYYSMYTKMTIISMFHV